MDKREFFLNAINDMQNRPWAKKQWIISLFSVVEEDEHDWADHPFPYRVVRKEDGVFFIDLSKNGDHTRIDGVVDGQPIFTIKERIQLKKGDVKNLFEDTETNYGQVIFNVMVLIYPFGDKLPFLHGKVNAKALNQSVADRLSEYPKPGVERSHDQIYVDELIRYTEALSGLGGLATICVPAASPKSITIDPKILKRRDELLLEHKDHLQDPAVIAKIEAELVEMDKASLKEDAAAGFLFGNNVAKTFGVARKRMFIMHGMETGFANEDSEVVVVPTSLQEGWDINNLPAMADSVRAGSYNRGFQTALGGESVKYFQRVYQNTKIIETDCGSVEGLPWVITAQNWAQFKGLHIAGTHSEVGLSEAELRAKIGSKIILRSPMLCKTTAPSFCARCMGDRIAKSPKGLTIAASDIGGKFMSIFMAKMHGTALTTSHFDFRKQLI